MKKALLLLLAILCLGAFESQATHMMGADVKYTCLGKGKYKVTLKVYRDCTGINLGGISGTISCGSYSTTFSPTKKGVRDITPTCASSVSACKNRQSGLGIGVEEHTYEAIIDFSKAPYSTWRKNGCCEFRFSWGQCCRNGEITTINNGSFYADAMVNLCNIDKTKKKCNDSPDLTSDPIAFLCCNNPYYFNNGALDNQDYDSLSYSLVAPLSGAGRNITLNSPFDPKHPMTPKCIPPGKVDCKPVPNAKPPLGFYLDPINGDLVFTPTKCDEVGIVVIEIKEWRADSATGKMLHIGTTRRDMQLIVMNCGSNWPPEIKSSKYDYTVCEGDNIKITIEGKDQPHPSDPNGRKDTVALKWNFGIPQGKFKVTNPSDREKKAEFTWQTKIGDAQKTPYTFTVTAQDDACPLKATTIKGYSIKVLPRALGKRTYNLLKCGAMEFFAEPNNGFAGPAEYSWQIYDSTDLFLPIYSSNFKKDTVQFQKGGTYYFKLNLNNSYKCPNITTDTIHIPDLFAIDLAFGGDTFVCIGSPLRIKPIMIHGVSPFRYKWKTPKDHAFADTLAAFEMNATTDTAIGLVVEDGNGCFDSTEIKVFIKQLPIVDLGPDVVLCTYEDVTFDAAHNDTLKYFWLPTGDTTQKITTNLAGTYEVEVSDSLGCVGRDTVDVIVNDTVLPYAGPDVEICDLDTLYLRSEGKPDADFDSRQFLWKNLTTNANVGSGAIEKVTPSVDGCYELYMEVVQNGHSCENADTMCVVVNPLPDLTTKPLKPYCYNDGKVSLTADAAPTTPDLIFGSATPGLVEKIGSTWWFNTPMLDPTKGHRIYITKEYTNPVTFCYKKDSFLIEILDNPVVKAQDRTFCQDYGEVELSSAIAKIVILPTQGNIKGGFRTWTILNKDGGNAPAGALRNDGTSFDAKWILNLGLGNSSSLGKYEMEFKFENTSSGCIGYDTMILSVVEVPVVAFTPIPEQCNYWDTLDLDNYVNLNSGKWTVLKKNNQREQTPGEYSTYVIEDHKFDPSIVGTEAFTTFYLKYEHVLSGCPTSDSIGITVNGRPDLEAGILLDTQCNTTPSLNLSAKVYGSANNAVVWEGTHVSGSTFLPTNVMSDTASSDFVGPYVLKYSYQDPFTTCESFDSTEVVVQVQPTINILLPTDNQGLCEDDVFILNAESTFDNGILWSTPGDGSFVDASSLNTEYNHGPDDKAAKGVTLAIETLPYGPACPAVNTSVDILIHPKPLGVIGTRASECAPYSADFFFQDTGNLGLGNLAYAWDLDDGKTSTIQNPVGILYTSEGDYDVSLVVSNMDVADGSCSTTIDSANYIRIHPIPVANFTMAPDGFTTVAIPEFSFQNTSTISKGSIVSYNWDLDIQNKAGFDPSDRYSTLENPVINYGTDTLTTCVSLSIVSDEGCRDSIVKCLNVGPDVTVFIPNAFTPNGAGPPEDNTFWVSVNGHVGFNLQIFNRWGELLFESDKATEPQFGWDGTYSNGEIVQQDAYMYVCAVQGFDGETYEYKGSVTLLR